MRGGIYASGVIGVRWHCCAGGIIDAWRHLVRRMGANSSEDFKVIPGQVPLFVYYRVAVLFNKWYVSDKAVAIV